MSRRFRYEYMVGYNPTWASTFRLDKDQRMLPERYSNITEAIEARHALENRERYQVYREMRQGA